jgi:hypothetical protein
MSTASAVVRAVCWDFDGVLMMPWTHPEEPFAQTRAIVKYLHEHGILMAATSFNPAAWLALEQHGLTQYLSAFRIGCNSAWAHHDHSQYDDAKHRVDLCKGKQMADILENEWAKHSLQRQEVLLIDDDKGNTSQAVKAGFRALYVPDSFLGPNWRAIHQELPQIPPPDAMQMRFLTPDEHHGALLKASVALRFFSKIQEHAPVKVNDALTQLGAMSKLLGTGAFPPGHQTPSSTLPLPTRQASAGKRKAVTVPIQDHSVSDLETILASTTTSLQEFTQLHEKVRKVHSDFPTGGIEVLLQRMTDTERELCSQSLGSFSHHDLPAEQRTRAQNLGVRFAPKH